MRWLVGITDPKDMSLSKLQEMVKDREAGHVAAHGAAKSPAWLSDWTIKYYFVLEKIYTNHIHGKTIQTTPKYLQSHLNYVIFFQNKACIMWIL